MTKPLGARQCPEKRRAFPKHTTRTCFGPPNLSDCYGVRTVIRNWTNQVERFLQDVIFYRRRGWHASPVRVLLRPICTGFRLCVWVRRSLF